MKHVISLGAGVQSSTMALMAKHGEITPMPECAIFADTQWEPRAVYEWLEWLEKQLPFPVYRVTAGNIRHDQMTKRRTIGKTGKNGKTDRFASMPYFVNGERVGKLKRQCTTEYKVEPIEKFIRRELLGVKPRCRVKKGVIVTQWRGISADEAHRMKPSSTKWITVRYPLAMEHRMTRGDCLAWMDRHGYPKPPRSACIGCPFHNDQEWLDIRNRRPQEWQEAVEFDAAIRNAGGMRNPTFVHRDCVPLDKVEFRADRQTDAWGEECQGMCGV